MWAASSLSSLHRRCYPLEWTLSCFSAKRLICVHWNLHFCRAASARGAPGSRPSRLAGCVAVHVARSHYLRRYQLHGNVAEDKHRAIYRLTGENLHLYRKFSLVLVSCWHNLPVSEEQTWIKSAECTHICISKQALHMLTVRMFMYRYITENFISIYSSRVSLYSWLC